MINKLARFNRVRYFLYGNTGTLTNFHPKGWNDDKKELLRSNKYDGIMANLNNLDLQFYAAAFYFLKSEYDINGIKAEVRIEKEERNSNTDQWENIYTGYLDFSTYKQNKNYVSIKINENNFFKNIESRFKDEFELERLTDLKKGVLTPLPYKEIDIQSRDIFIKSYFNNDKKYWLQQSDSDYVAESFALPLKLIYKSDENVFQPSVNVDETTGQITNSTSTNSPGGSSIGHCFYATADNTNEVNLKINGIIKIISSATSGPHRIWYQLGRYIYNEGTGVFSDGIITNGPYLFLNSSNSLNGVDYEIDIDLTFNKRIGESFVLWLTMSGAIMPIYFEYTNLEVSLEETQQSVITKCNGLTYYQAFDRVLNIITGKQCFKSELLSNEWKDLIFTNGHKIRQNTEKNITTSLQELYDSISAIDDVAIFIENNNFILEKKSRAYQNEISIDLGNVNNIEREIDDKKHFSSIEIGADFDGIYEEVSGLEEYNIKTKYTTCIDVIESKFSEISKVRFDSYAISLLQNKLIQNFPKLDTKYDKYNFAIDCILENGIYRVRHWQDDFLIGPTGVFSPQTAFNLRLSPVNSLFRKAKSISTGLLKYPNEKLEYATTTGNSLLVTTYPERISIENKDLPQPYYLPEIIKFSKQITEMQFKIISQNPYKLIKFVNEFGDYDYGFIMPSIIKDKETKFSLIKANI